MKLQPLTYLTAYVKLISTGKNHGAVSTERRRRDLWRCIYPIMPLFISSTASCNAENTTRVYY